ncbi:MAG: hypothetical protein IPH18_13575 [Chitinophagaceae bacterium]|nr:hypothetical protein [Chitinophagaceae bacterium]
MKRYFIPFPAIFFSISILAQSKVDILHYKYEIELNDNNDTIHGKSEIKFSVPTVFKSIDFDLSGKPETGKGMQIMRITYPDAWPVDASYDGKNFQHKNDKITINTERISLKKTQVQL